MLCTELTLVKKKGSALTFEPLRCKRWTCEHCNPLNHKALRRKCLDGHPTTMITLTSNPAMGDSPDARARRMVEAWRLIRQSWSREHAGQKIPFIAVFERTRRGEPHIHILCRAPYIPQRWLSRRMRELSGAPVCDIRQIKNKSHAAYYVAKYLSKGTHRFIGCKRYWRSHDFDLHKEDRQKLRATTECHVIRRTYLQVQEDYRRTGFTIADDVKGVEWIFGWWSGDLRRRRC